MARSPSPPNRSSRPGKPPCNKRCTARTPRPPGSRTGPSVRGTHHLSCTGGQPCSPSPAQRSPGCTLPRLR
eukprot:scaffold6445_cov63-Phaeocystis_antarctica.AAC.4